MKKATGLKGLLTTISLSEYGSEGLRVRLRRLFRVRFCCLLSWKTNTGNTGRTVLGGPCIRNGPIGSRFRRVRFRTPNSVSFFGLIRVPGSELSEFPLSLLFVCFAELTEFFAELTRVCRRTQWVLSPETVLSKQYSARFPVKKRLPFSGKQIHHHRGDPPFFFFRVWGSTVYTLLSGPMVYTLFPLFSRKMVYTIAFLLCDLGVGRQTEKRGFPRWCILSFPLSFSHLFWLFFDSVSDFLGPRAERPRELISGLFLPLWARRLWGTKGPTEPETPKKSKQQKSNEKVTLRAAPKVTKK